MDNKDVFLSLVKALSRYAIVIGIAVVSILLACYWGTSVETRRDVACPVYDNPVRVRCESNKWLIHEIVHVHLKHEPLEGETLRCSWNRRTFFGVRLWLIKKPRCGRHTTFH